MMLFSGIDDKYLNQLKYMHLLNFKENWWSDNRIISISYNSNESILPISEINQLLNKIFDNDVDYIKTLYLENDIVLLNK